MSEPGSVLSTDNNPAFPHQSPVSTDPALNSLGNGNVLSTLVPLIAYILQALLALQTTNSPTDQSNPFSGQVDLAEAPPPRYDPTIPQSNLQKVAGKPERVGRGSWIKSVPIGDDKPMNTIESKQVHNIQPSSSVNTKDSGADQSLITGDVNTPPSLEGNNVLGANVPAGLQQFSKEIAKASTAAGVPANVLGAMIWQESRGNLGAATINGGNGLTDTGLLQVNPNTYQDLQAKHPELQGMDNLSDPQTNIMAGAFYMKDLIAQFGDIPTALRAYNSGPNGVDRDNLSSLPAGTGDATYVDKVSDFANRLATGVALPA